MTSVHTVEQELDAAVQRILSSSSRRKLIVAGPGTGKTTIFKKLLQGAPGNRDTRLVLTFIRNLTADLRRDLGSLARVSTLHGYCQALLHKTPQLRGRLSETFCCVPGLASLIAADWEILRGSTAPQFVKGMRDLTVTGDIDFYFDRADWYDAVDFDDSVYRIVESLREHPHLVENLDLLLVDEFQDFNTMEAVLIELLTEKSPIVIAGDDDQALYSQLRAASWDHIRSLHAAGKYEVFNLPFCMRCPEVIVGAVNDVVTKARALLKLTGRIDKPYKHFAPRKGGDSKRYPKITVIESSVQTSRANYLGRYIVSALATIPVSEIEESHRNNEPTVLVIGPKHYLDPIASALHDSDIPFEAGGKHAKRIDRDMGLEILSETPESNVGWRIILEHETDSIRASRVRAAFEQRVPLFKVISDDLRMSVLAEAAAWQAQQAQKGAEPEPRVDSSQMRIKLTSFEGSKGLSAQHVFILGLQEGVLPKKQDPQDIEVCRFLVGMTRAKKRCCLLHTRRFANKPVAASPFLNWIDRDRCHRVFIDAKYWTDNSRKR